MDILRGMKKSWPWLVGSNLVLFGMFFGAVSVFGRLGWAPHVREPLAAAIAFIAAILFGGVETYLRERKRELEQS